MILLLPMSDIGLLRARAVRKVMPYRNTSPARPFAGDLSALVVGTDLAVMRLLGRGRACDGGPDVPLVASCSGFGEIAASTYASIARERGVA